MALPVNGSTHLIPTYYSFIDPERMKGWVGLVGWPIADGLPTLVVRHQLQVERRTGKVRQSETDVLPLCYAAVYLLLFSVSYYLHNASGARYRRSACTDVDMLRLAAAACCDMGWISAQRCVGLLCDWSSVLKRLEACINAEGGHSEHLCDIPCLTFQSPHITTGYFQSHRRQPTTGSLQSGEEVLQLTS